MIHLTSPLQVCMTLLLFCLMLPTPANAAGASFDAFGGTEVYINIPKGEEGLKHRDDWRTKNGMRGKLIDAKTCKSKLPSYSFVRFPDHSRGKFRTNWVEFAEGQKFCAICHKVCYPDTPCSRPDCNKFNTFKVNLAKHCNTCHEPTVAADEYMPWLPKGSHEAWGLEPVKSPGYSCFQQDCLGYKAFIKQHGYTVCSECQKVEVPVDGYTPVALGSRKPTPDDRESPGVSCLNRKCSKHEAFIEEHDYRRRMMAWSSSRLINRFIRESIRCQQS